MTVPGTYYDDAPKFVGGPLPRLIGLGGYAGSGKDAVADILVTWGYRKTYMSKPLEQALLAVDPWVPTDTVGEGWTRYSTLHGDVGYTESKTNPEVRRLLQMLGTEVGREMIDPDVWANIVFGEASRWMTVEHAMVAVTAMRFPNELRILKSLGGVSAWVDRPGYGPVNDHVSDNTLKPEDFDVIIYNDGTLEELGPKALSALAANQ